MSVLPMLILGSLAWAQVPAGGGPAPVLPGDEISAQQRARIDAMLERNVIELERKGALAPAVPAMLLQGGVTVGPSGPPTKATASPTTRSG